MKVIIRSSLLRRLRNAWLRVTNRKCVATVREHAAKCGMSPAGFAKAINNLPPDWKKQTYKG